MRAGEGGTMRIIISVMVAVMVAAAYFLDGVAVYPKVTAQEALLYTNQLGDNLRGPIVSAIRSAQESVFVIIYSLTDEDVIRALRQKAESGVPVTVVYDFKASYKVDEKLGSAVHAIPRVAEGLVHQKILLIDGDELWIGSANFTPESLTLHPNLVTVVKSPRLGAQILERIEHQNPLAPIEGFYITPDNKVALNVLKQQLRSAQKSIRVAMFTFTHKELAQELVEAKKRGVKVEVLLDRQASQNAGSKVTALLRQEKVPLKISKGKELLHHKFCWIDGDTLINGSLNWTQSAFRQNEDCFMILGNLTEGQKSFMQNVWDDLNARTKAP